MQDNAKAAPVITVYPDGRIEVGKGYSIGDVLNALDVARRAVLGVVLNPPTEADDAKA